MYMKLFLIREETYNSSTTGLECDANRVFPIVTIWKGQN